MIRKINYNSEVEEKKKKEAEEYRIRKVRKKEEDVEEEENQENIQEKMQEDSSKLKSSRNSYLREPGPGATRAIRKSDGDQSSSSTSSTSQSIVNNISAFHGSSVEEGGVRDIKFEFRTQHSWGNCFDNCSCSTAAAQPCGTVLAGTQIMNSTRGVKTTGGRGRNLSSDKAKILGKSGNSGPVEHPTGLSDTKHQANKIPVAQNFQQMNLKRSGNQNQSN